MPAFTVSGIIEGRPATLTWRDGRLDGDASAIARVDELVAAGEMLSMTPTGPSVAAALEPDWVAARTLAEVFDGRAGEITGDVSEPPYLRAAAPAGAVF